MVFLDILIFAMVAGFLIYRLRNVLGRRHGEERQLKNPFTKNAQKSQESAEDQSVIGGQKIYDSMENGIQRIKEVDPSFDDQRFISGAKVAFQMIVKAFNEGDTETLEKFLNEKVYDHFCKVIQERRSVGEVWETTLYDFISVKICEAVIKNREINITVEFVSLQSKVIRDNHDRIIEGDPQQQEKITDVWTFAKYIRSRDLNWVLIRTRTKD